MGDLRGDAAALELEVPQPRRRDDRVELGGAPGLARGEAEGLEARRVLLDDVEEGVVRARARAGRSRVDDDVVVRPEAADLGGKG